MAFEVILKDVFGGLVDTLYMPSLTFFNRTYWSQYRISCAI